MVERRHWFSMLLPHLVLWLGVLIVACAVVTVNLLIDLIYSAVDPRVRLGGASA